MSVRLKHLALVGCALSLPLVAHWVVAGAGQPAAAAYFRSAPVLNQASKAPVYAAALAGERAVAVGDYGSIILSDDGKTFRQAKVPTRAPLTAVHFVDARQGWAAGHDGTILSTQDGGESWQIQREAAGQDQVLLAIWFADARRGLAVGQFGLALRTEDGGQTWNESPLVDGEAGERHLLAIVPGRDGLVLVAAEAGGVLRSTDQGRHWQAVQTENKGSFWTGIELADGSLLLSGMRGNLYRSDDRGAHWRRVESGTQQSLTSVVTQPDGSVHFVGLGGVSLTSSDAGRSFALATRVDRQAQTAVVRLGQTNLVFGTGGLLAQP